MLTDSDKRRIVSAVQGVERQTDGEVVVCVTASSGTYPVARWRAAVFFALLSLAVIFIIRPSTTDWAPLWMGSDLLAVGVCIMVGLLGVVLTAQVGVFKRAFVFDSELRREVEKAASESFIAEEVFNTRNRTGILIFVSEFERFFEVVADSGIDELVDTEQWVSIVDEMIAKRASDDLTSAIIQGIELCGAVLSRNVPVVEPASNELDDRVRTDEGEG